MKKFLSIVLSLTMVLGLCAFSALAANETEIFYENFSAAEFANNQNGGYYASPSETSSFADTGNVMFGKALHLQSITTKENGGKYNVGTDAALGVVFDTPYDARTNKVLLSYDVRPNQTTQALSVALNTWINNGGISNNLAYTLYLTSSGYITAAQTGAEWDGGTTMGSYTPERWMHVDMLVSKANKTIDYYIDGQFEATINLGDSVLNDGRIYSLVFRLPTNYSQGTGTGVDSVDIDNIAVNYISADGYALIAAAYDDSSVDVVFGEPLTNLDEITPEIRIAETNAAVAVSEWYKINERTLRIVGDAAFQKNREHRVVISGETVSSLGHEIASQTAYFSIEEETNENILFKMDGSETDSLPSVYLSDVLSADSDRVSWTDIGGNNGRCVEIKGDASSTVSAVFNMASPSEGSKIKVSYEFYPQQTNQAFAQLLNPWYTGCDAAGDNNQAPHYITMLSNGTGFASSASGLSPWHADNRGQSWSPSYTANTWFKVEAVYDFAARTFTRTITNKATGVVTTIFANSALHTEVLKGNAVKSLTFRVINGNLPNVSASAGANPGDARFLVDNIVIEDITPVVKVKNVRFTDYNGETVMPDTEIAPEISAVMINIDGADESELASAVSLMLNDTPVSYSGAYENGTYTMTLTDGALKPQSNYTVSVSGLEGMSSDYSYSFRTKNGKLIITEFELQKNGSKASLADLNVNDNVYIKLHVINTTGLAQQMTASICSYNGFLMSGIDFENITIGADELTYDNDGNISLIITDTENVDVKGFLWDSFESLTPITDAAELTK